MSPGLIFRAKTGKRAWSRAQSWGALKARLELG